MDVHYEQHGYRSPDYTDETSMGVSYWIRWTLDRKPLSNALALLAIMGEQWLSEHPERIQDVADAIGCEGFNHRLTEGE